MIFLRSVEMNIVSKFVNYMHWERNRLAKSHANQINYKCLPPVFAFYDFFNGINTECILDQLKHTKYDDLYDEAERHLILGNEGMARNLLKNFIVSDHMHTLIHVHVPKSAGTSLNYCLHRFFYKNQSYSLPGNTTPHLLRYFFENGVGKVPFLTTGHIPLDALIDMEKLDAKNSRVFYVKRDDAARLNSLRNQLVSSLISFKFFNRPFAYFVHVKATDFWNRKLFPHNIHLRWSVEFCLGKFKDCNLHIEQVELFSLHCWLRREFNVDLEHLDKNRTFNLSRFLIKI